MHTPADGETEGRPNVVFLVMDTTRATDVFPLDDAVTPTLSSLASRGTAYTRAFATAPWTLPSHASMFTGTYPSRHGADASHTRLGDDLATLAECFADAEYETVGVSNNVWVAEEFGFTRGFEHFEEYGEDPHADDEEADEEPGGLGGLLPDRLRTGGPADVLAALGRRIGGDGDTYDDSGARRTVEWVEEWAADRTRGDPFFLFVNCIEPHITYEPPRDLAERLLPEGWDYESAMALRQDPREFDVGEFDHTEEEWEVLRALHRASVAYLDRQVGALRDALAAAGEWDDTVFVAVGDHGENIGEHGLFGHQYGLYDTLLHVPLVAAGGAFASGAPRDDRLVQTLDLAPTLLDAAGVRGADLRAEAQGHSFYPTAEAPGRDRVFAEYDSPRPPVEALEERFGSVPEHIYTLQRSLRAVRTDRYKYVRGSDGSEWLYDLAVDPDERADRSAESPERAAELDAELDEWLSSFEHADESDSVAVSQSTAERLSDLGYL